MDISAFCLLWCREQPNTFIHRHWNFFLLSLQLRQKKVKWKKQHQGSFHIQLFDDSKRRYSKKEAEVRQSAIRDFISEPLLKYCGENVSSLIVDPYGSDVLVE